MNNGTGMLYATPLGNMEIYDITYPAGGTVVGSR